MKFTRVSYAVKARNASVLKRHPLLHIAAISLLAAQAIPNIASAQVEAAPPLAGVLGKVQSFTGKSLDVQTVSGVVHVAVKQPIATFGAWCAAPPSGAGKTRFEECEGNYQADVSRAGAERLLGRTWIFPL